MTDKKCPYCEFDEYDIIDKNEFAVILPDSNPLSKGHCVVTPLRHVRSFLISLLKNIKACLHSLKLLATKHNFAINQTVSILASMMVKYSDKILIISTFMSFRTTKTNR